MEVEETTLPVVENSDENNPKKEKILTLLFPSETVPAEGKEAKKDKNKPLTKVVVRRLPPRLTKEAFIEEFSPLPTHDYFHFVRGDLSLGSHSFSRAYINFLNQNDIYMFKEKFDDYGIQDDKGKTYHAVVEFAPFQRIPRRNIIKKKLSKAGTLESDPKYIEFLKKLEEYKNNATNTSEYFHETESTSLKVKVTTTPLLEYLKQRKQKKNDLKNELRPRKREMEKERKRKEEERRKNERDRRKEGKKNSRYDDRSRMIDDKPRKSDDRLKENRKNEIRGRSKEDKKDVKNWKVVDNAAEDYKSDVVIPTDPAILKVVIRQPEKSNDRNGKSKLSAANEENKTPKNTDSDSSIVKNEKKYSDFRTRLAEEKQRKTFQKRDLDTGKNLKSNWEWHQGVPDEKGDNYNIGNCSETKEYGKKSESELDLVRKQDYKMDQKEAKSKFRYSEQRNREREHRNQKASGWKVVTLGASSKVKSRMENMSKEMGKDADVSRSNNDELRKITEKENNDSNCDLVEKLLCRRRSLELDKKCVQEVKKRSRSFHDLSNKKIVDFRLDRKPNKTDLDKDGMTINAECETIQPNEFRKRSNGSEKADDENKKDPRVERRIRNKDRPSLEIYRPGMGKFSKQRLEQKKDESNSTNPSGSQNSVKNSRISKTIKKSAIRNDSVEHGSPIKLDRADDLSKAIATSGKTIGEVRTMTFTRSGSNEN